MRTKMTTTGKRARGANWIAWVGLSWCLLAIYATFFVEQRQGPFLWAAHRDVGRISVIGWTCSWICNFLPTQRRVKCVLAYVALEWAMHRSTLREKLRDPDTPKHARFLLRAHMVSVGWGARAIAGSVHAILAGYGWLIDYLCLIAARLRKDGPSLDAIELDNGMDPHQLDSLIP